MSVLFPNIFEAKEYVFVLDFFCSTFVLDFVFSCFFPFDILFLYTFFILFSFENDSSCFSAVLQCLSNETGNHFVQYNFAILKQFEMIQV
jgi:hypothetical protein